MSSKSGGERSEQLPKLVLDVNRKYRMKRWRLMHKHTGEVVEMSGMTLHFVCHCMGWQEEDVYWVELGSKYVLLEPRRRGRAV